MHGCICVYMSMCVYTYILVIDYHGNLVSHLQFQGEWEVGAMVQIINQTGSANPLQVSCTKASRGLRSSDKKLWYNYNMYVRACTYMYVAWFRNGGRDILPIA